MIDEIKDETIDETIHYTHTHTQTLLTHLSCDNTVHTIHTYMHTYDVFHLFWEALRNREEKKKKVGEAKSAY
jgi:hypothetical protein